MAIRLTVCFAPGKGLSMAGAQYFGSEIAEPAIVRDYLTLTQGSVLGNKERDWWDEGLLHERVENHLSILHKRHSLSPATRESLRKSPVPDILTYQGLDREMLRGEAVFQVATSAVKFVRMPVLIPVKGNRHEFYEIKPANVKGQSDGRDKVDALRKNYSDAGLPYAAGTTYPDVVYLKSVAHIPLLARSATQVQQWKSAVKVAMVREKLARIDLYLEVSRKGLKDGGRMPSGLLLYRVCIAIEAENDMTDSVAVRIARDLVHAWTVVETATLPEEIRTGVREAFLAFEPVAVTRGDGPEMEPKVEPILTTPGFPLVNVQLTEILPPLRSTESAIRDALISRGIGLPGEEYLVCCDQAFFAMLAGDSTVLNLLTVIQKTPLRWHGYLKDRGSLGVLEMIIEVNEFIAQARALGLDVFTDLVKWGNENPGKRTVVILVVLIVAAATIYITAPLIAAELGFTAIAATPVVETTAATGARVMLTETVSTQTARVAMQQEIMREALLQEAAQAALQRQAAQQIVQTTVQATAVPRGAVVLNAARSALIAQATTPIGRQAAAEFLKAAKPGLMMGGVGITIGASGRVAYAAEQGRAPEAEAKGTPIGIQVGRMFLLQVDAAPPPPPAWLANLPPPPPRAFPRLGQEFDAARFSKEAAATLKPGGPGELKCRYLGRLKLT